MQLRDVVDVTRCHQAGLFRDAIRDLCVTPDTLRDAKDVLPLTTAQLRRAFYMLAFATVDTASQEQYTRFRLMVRPFAVLHGASFVLFRSHPIFFLGGGGSAAPGEGVSLQETS